MVGRLCGTFGSLFQVQYHFHHVMPARRPGSARVRPSPPPAPAQSEPAGQSPRESGPGPSPPPAPAQSEPVTSVAARLRVSQAEPSARLGPGTVLVSLSGTARVRVTGRPSPPSPPRPAPAQSESARAGYRRGVDKPQVYAVLNEWIIICRLLPPPPPLSLHHGGSESLANLRVFRVAGAN